MAWDYAELSKRAKDAGGPEQLIDLLIDSGRDKGHKDMLPFVGVAVLIGVISTKAFEYFKKEKAKSYEIESAKKTIIDGINKYDSEHDIETTDL